jgi:hypothetical protein
MAVMTDRGEIILEKDEILRALYAPNSTLFYLEPVYEPVTSPQAKSVAPAAPASSPAPTAVEANPVPAPTSAVSPNSSPQPSPSPVLKGYAFVGGGFGHGVGMSQTGAYRLGRMGWSNSQILSFYYPGTQLQPLTNAITFWRDASPDAPGADLDRN